MAEESAVLKLSGKTYEKFVGPAMCFDDEDDAFEAIVEGRVAKGSVMVIRYEGPKGAPGMPEMLSPGAALVGAGLGKGKIRWIYRSSIPYTVTCICTVWMQWVDVASEMEHSVHFSISNATYTISTLERL